jgi:hypothetical protein
MDQQRRQVLGASAAALLASGCASAGAQQGVAKTATPSAAFTPPPGNAGEFNFLAGEWRIAHRRPKSDGTWDEFEGEATCFTILGGVGSVEELRIPSRDFSGMGLRLLDVTNHVWRDFWVNARSGVIGGEGMPGGFENGAGTFIADDVDGDQPIKVRGVWDAITPTSCRWTQAISRDGGQTWEENWFMQWTRVG